MEGQGHKPAGPEGERTQGLRKPNGLIIMRVGATQRGQVWGAVIRALLYWPRENVHDTRMNINHPFCPLCLYIKYYLRISPINITLIITYKVGTIIILILHIQKWRHRQVK